jgi:predicted RNA-binding Zn ribbon-like protein
MSSDHSRDGPFADHVHLGGALCLDLANTVDWRSTERARDWLEAYDDLLAWAEALAIMPRHVIAGLRAQAQRDPAGAARLLHRAKLLREAVYAVFSALACRGGAATADLDRLASLAAPMLAKTGLDVKEAVVVWGGAATDPARLLWAPTWSAIDLLRGPDRHRLRECLNPDCHWLFLDQSRNRSRRWCAMSNCGSREKNRRHYAIHRKGGTGRPR